jgi:hypothetical protein
MLAQGQDDFNANNFLNKGQKSLNFLIQKAKYQHKLKMMKKMYHDYCKVKHTLNHFLKKCKKFQF